MGYPGRCTVSGVITIELFEAPVKKYKLPFCLNAYDFFLNDEKIY